MDRRSFLRRAAVGAGATLALGPDFWKSAYAAPAQPGTVYGPLLPPDANGLRLPAGFTSRVVATSLQPVGNTGQPWHLNPDGGACFSTGDGGWIYVSNSEVPLAGGVGAIRFAQDGKIIGSHRVLVGTNINCAGGPTPWGTWLTCEEFDYGHVFECNPAALNNNATAIRLALGSFSHEAAAVDPDRKHVYLTEDEEDGCFYRFTPDEYPNLRKGKLEALQIIPVAGFDPADPRWTCKWHEIPNPNVLPGTTFTRHQVPQTTPFKGGEGLWYDSGFVYFTTKHDQRVWCLDAENQTMELVYDEKLVAGPSVLHGVDNVVVNKAGEIFVAEDGGQMRVVVIDRDRNVQPFLQVMGHDGSEITGPAFSPRGDRFYFSSQRGKNPQDVGGVVAVGSGVTYEITGPFRASSATRWAMWPGIVTKPIHNTVEPALDGAAPLKEQVHAVDKVLRRLGL